MSQQQFDVFSNRFAERLRILRGSKSKAAFARELGIENPQTYQRYEKDRIPDPVILDRISTQCGKSVDWLLGRDPVREVRESQPQYDSDMKATPRRIIGTLVQDASVQKLEEILDVCTGAGDAEWIQIIGKELAKRARNSQSESNKDNTI